MKRHFWILLLLMSACEKSSEEKNIPLIVNNLAGKWQLSETYINPGGATEWMDVENGSIYTFAIDATYSLMNTSEATFDESGTYKVKKDTLEVTYELNGETKVKGFHLVMTDTSITLFPAYPVICTEACLSRFKKLK